MIPFRAEMPVTVTIPWNGSLRHRAREARTLLVVDRRRRGLNDRLARMVIGWAKQREAADQNDMPRFVCRQLTDGLCALRG
jgi:hypothetical protein